jgi:hypothetical protein
MEFAPPVWVSKRVCYKFNINETNLIYIKSFVYATELGSKQQIPETTDDEFSDMSAKICEEFLKSYTKWFPGRTSQIPTGNLKHVWSFDITPDLREGASYQIMWKPVAFCFGGSIAEIHWSLIESSGISSKELEDTEIGNLPCSSDTDKIKINPETRRDYRKLVRQARLKATLCELKALKMAEEYYKRYDEMDELDDSELDLSDQSETAPTAG